MWHVFYVRAVFKISADGGFVPFQLNLILHRTDWSAAGTQPKPYELMRVVMEPSLQCHTGPCLKHILEHQ